MPNRIIREGILSSEKIALLGWPEEVFYRRLMSIVDDYGRTESNTQYLRARCYPLQTDLVRVADISRWMAVCQKAGMILVYGVGGKQYLEICNFRQQTRSASKCPSPDINCNQMISDDAQVKSFAHLGVSVVVSEGVSEGEGVLSDKPTSKRRSLLPIDFYPDSTGIKKASDLQIAITDELERFADFHKAKGSTMLDWQAAWRTWVSNAVKFSSKKGKESIHDKRARTIAGLTGQPSAEPSIIGESSRIS
jgi:hypothetical protein